jgi:hypothetical protein
VNTDLPWKVPSELVDGLVKYATFRINARRSTTSCNNEAPKVALTGRKIDYDKEFGLSFGDYCEIYDPKCQSNNAFEDRTEPCSPPGKQFNRVMAPLQPCYWEGGLPQQLG